MVFLLMCFVSVSAFSQIKDGFTKSENGVFYKVEKANPNGRAVKQGDIVVCNYSASYGDSLVFTNFNQEPIPTFAVSDQSRAFKGDMIDGLQLMKEGETYSFAFPYDSLAKMQKLPAFFKKGDFGYYTVAISKLMTQEEFQAEQERMIAEQKGFQIVFRRLKCRYWSIMFAITDSATLQPTACTTNRHSRAMEQSLHRTKK